MTCSYISLGSACDVALSLRRIGLREASYPFDWLWNLDSGLAAVTDMIETDFCKVLPRDSYQENWHYRFGRQMVTYQHYPSLVHLHSNPMIDACEHEKIVRRIQRFQDILQSPRKKKFIYYRSAVEDAIKDGNCHPEESLLRLLAEGKKFFQIIQEKFPSQMSTMELYLVWQVPVNFAIEGRRLLEKARKSLFLPDRCVLDFTIPRSEEGPLKTVWEKQWNRFLFWGTHMPLSLKTRLMAGSWLTRIGAFGRNLRTFFASSG